MKADPSLSIGTKRPLRSYQVRTRSNGKHEVLSYDYIGIAMLQSVKYE